MRTLLRVSALLLAFLLGLSPQADAKIRAPQRSPLTESRIGYLRVVHADDFARGRSRWLYHVEEVGTTTHVPLRFTGPPPAPANAGSLVTVTGTMTAGTLGVTQTGTRRLTVLETPMRAAVASVDRKTLVLLVHFTDAAVSCTAPQMRAMFFDHPTGQGIDDMYTASSHGALQLTGSVHGPYTIPYASTSPCNVYAWGKAADAAAVAQGVPVSTYRHRVYLMPQRNSCGYAGLGTGSGYTTSAWSFRCAAPDVAAHELGHNFALQHAATPSGEYADLSDPMGSAGPGLRLFNAPHTEAMGWLLSGQGVTATTSGVYTLGGLGQTPTERTGIRVLKIAKPDTKETYYLSYRLPVGFDAKLPATYVNRVTIHRYAGEGYKTFLIKILGDGEKFTDTVNGMIVTQIGHDATTATVQVAIVQP